MTFRTPTAWKTLKRTTLVTRSFLQLHEDRVQLENGQIIPDFCVLEAPAWVSVICVESNGAIVMVNQYRHGIAGSSLELPGGVMEEGETPEQSARRELLEETGYASEDFRSLITLASDPSRQTTRAHFFVAKNATQQAAQNLDPSEAIDVYSVPAKELFDRIDKGLISHGLQVAALLLAERRGWLK